MLVLLLHLKLQKLQPYVQVLRVKKLVTMTLHLYSKICQERKERQHSHNFYYRILL